MMRPSVSERSTSQVRIAVIGCGAITQSFHLPVLAGHEGVRVVALVDPALDRAQALARGYHVPVAVADESELGSGTVDAVLLATPPFLHAAGAVAWMRRGAHVLVEKPMALTAADAEAMAATAAETGRVLTVGVYRRLLPAIRLLRAALDAGALGDLQRIDIEVGSPYTWPLASLAGMRKEQSGGGMLMDMGTHVLDLLFETVRGTARLRSYEDNGLGGVETDCLLTLDMEHRRQLVPTRVELSRTRTLRNTYRMVCAHGDIEWSFGERYRIDIRPHVTLIDPLRHVERDFTVGAQWRDEPDVPGYESFLAQLDDFLGAIHGIAPSALSGASMLPVVRLIEECYARPARLPEPWVTVGLPAQAVEAEGVARPGAMVKRRRVLMTGAGGFIGTRTSERLLLASDWDVRAMVRTPTSLARLARLPVDAVLGDVLDPPSLARALQGCEAVVHAVVGTSWRSAERVAVNVQGTKNLVEAALAAGVQRFVHISSITVYGDDVTGTVDERAAVRPKPGWDYAESKAAAERIVLAAARERGLPAVVLRVAVVYGPFGPTVVVRPIEHLLRRALVLVDCRDVASNTVHVDNVAEAVRLALDAPLDQVAGLALNVTDDDGTTWGEYFGYFADALGAEVQHVRRAEWETEHPAPAPRGAVASFYRGTRDVVFSAETKALMMRVVESPWGTPVRWAFENYPNSREALKRLLGRDTPVVYRRAPAGSSDAPFVVDPIRARFSGALARERLGSCQVLDRQTAMASTLAWLRAARIAPPPTGETAREEIAEGTR